MDDTEKDNVQLAFSFSDEDFMAFLPESEKEQFVTPWSDFNFHDPGVTAYEAMQLSFEDFFYRYDFPIQDLMQGFTYNAFKDWGVNDLYTLYAVTENDYRRVLATHKYLQNIAVKPVLKANLNPNTEDLICLLNVNVAVEKLISTNAYERKWERDLIKNRAVGEYFNRQSGQETFIRNKKKDVKIRTKLALYPIGEDVLYYRKIFSALENYLLPDLEPADYRTIKKRGRDLSELYSGPRSSENDQENVINEKLFNQPAYRRFIMVSELFEVLESLSFIRKVDYIQIATVEGGRYEGTVLDLRDYTFTELFELEINNELLKRNAPIMKLEAPPVSDDLEDKNEQPNFTKELVITGQYRNLSASPSLQQSFPPNYQMGRYLADQSNEELNKTASFRAFLYLMDQVRANISGQMGEFYKIFSITEELPSFVEADISDKPDYRKIMIPDLNAEREYQPNKTEESIRLSTYYSDNIEVQNRFTEERLNYLLALNGWGAGVNASSYWSRTQYTTIKNDFLNLVHDFSSEKVPEVNKGFNACLRSNSLVLLQEKLRVLLQFDVIAVRVLEHLFLQPVWEGARGLNFELTIFLFLKEEPKHPIGENGEYKSYVQQMIRAMVPAHIVESVKWIPYDDKNHSSKTVEMYDSAIKEAIPPKETYYLDSEITSEQRAAMIWLKNDWIQQ